MKKVGILVFVGLLSLGSNAFAQTGDSKNTKPTIVFVHGLWADGSSWSKVINPLVDKGYKVISVQNPTTSLEDDVTATKRAIDRADGDVILVGHSWGGSVITEAGADQGEATSKITSMSGSSSTRSAQASTNRRDSCG
jgi:pimeloyl-ACP methyl ester carboxylesterase